MGFRFRFSVLVVVLALGLLTVQSVHAAASVSAETDLEITLSTTKSEAWEGERIVWQVSLINASDQVLSEVQLSAAGQTWSWPDGAVAVGVLSMDDGIVVEVPTIALEDGEIWPALIVEWVVGGTRRSLLAIADRPLRVRPIREAVQGHVLLARGTVYRGGELPLQVQIANHSPFPLTDVTLTGQGTDLAWGGISQGEDVPAGETRTISLSPMVAGDNPQAIIALEFHWIDAATRESDARLLLDSEAAQIKHRIPVDIPWSAIMAILGFLLGWLTWWLQHRKERAESRQVNCERALGMLSLSQVQTRHGANEGTEIALDLVQNLFCEEGLYAAMERLDQQKAGLISCVHDIWQAAYRHNAGLHRPDGAQRTKILREKADELDDLLRDLKCKE